MKSKTITFEEVEYEIRSFGFFKANRILLGTLLPLFKNISGSLSSMKEGEQDLKEMFASILQELNPEAVEDVMKKMLANIYVDDKKFDPNDIEDFGLGIDLIQGSIELNYSSLGKIIGKLTDMLPED